jgi:non-specific serine/threonine protein kinase
LRAKALNEAGFIALFQGDLGRATAMLEESLALSKDLGDKLGITTSIQHLVYALVHAGDSAHVARLREEAEELRSGHLNQQTLAHLLDSLALAALDAYDYEQALACAEEAATLHREIGDLQGIIISLTALGMITLEAGDPERAKLYFEENLQLLQKMEHKMGIAYCLLGLAGVAGEQVRPDRAARLWGAAEALREAIGMNLSPFDRSHYRYENRLAAARSLISEEIWEAAWSEGRAMTLEQAVGYALGEVQELAPPVAPTSEKPSAGRQAIILTRREGEVATLVAGGLTNRQIAEELFVSERTVENHVSNILKKLDLSSREQVASRLDNR